LKIVTSRLIRSSQVIEHGVALLGIAIRIDRVGIPDIRSKTACRRAVVLWAGVNRLSLLCLKQHLACCHRSCAHGHSVFRQALKSMIADSRTHLTLAEPHVHNVSGRAGRRGVSRDRNPGFSR
jgi:hypothetical protein